MRNDFLKVESCALFTILNILNGVHCLQDKIHRAHHGWRPFQTYSTSCSPGCKHCHVLSGTAVYGLLNILNTSCNFITFPYAEAVLLISLIDS